VRATVLIRAVLFDLDDTFYPQAEWLRGAWRAVAKRAAALGLDPDALESALLSICAEGSDRGRIIDRALASLGAPETPVASLVEAFRAHAPRSLTPYPGARAALDRLRGDVAVGLVTDGDIAVQRAKLRALGLGEAFDVIVLSDALGRRFRKPHPAPFEAALAALGTRPQEAVYIGDRPDKDVAGAAAAGVRAVRVFTGEYASARGTHEPWASAPDVVAAIELVSSRRVAAVLAST
jgi:putative hydrolase of the HAD superfamily